MFNSSQHSLGEGRGSMETAIILRCERKASVGGVRVWYEYAPVVDGRPKRRPTHMMASPESAADLARRYGFSVGHDVVTIYL